MEKKYDLKKIYLIDSMHDERIDKIEVHGENLVFHYSKLEYHEGYRSCKVIFIDGQCAMIEVREKEYPKITSTIYDIEEFAKFLTEKQYLVETIDYYCGLVGIIIMAALVSAEGYCEECIFRIPADELIYQWE